jgi:hypothetical protein
MSGLELIAHYVSDDFALIFLCSVGGTFGSTNNCYWAAV